jgi:hypothetical protein
MRFADETVERENGIKSLERIDKMVQGDYDSVLQEIELEVAEEAKKWKAQGIPQSDIKQLYDKEVRDRALDLVNKAVKKSMPYDPLTVGSAASAPRRQAIAASFGSGQAERALTMEQQALAARFLEGLGQSQVRRSPKAVRISQLTDQLIQQDPTLTPQQAKMLATQLLR